MAKGAVSVVIPCYNVADTVGRAVASVLPQEPVREIILVDNNSTDGTGKTLDELRAAHPKKITVLSAQRRGAGAARNVGISRAAGEWIQFLDADDYLYPGKIARQLNLARPSTGWIMGTSDYVDPQGRKFTLPFAADPWKGLAWCRGLGDTNANLFNRAALQDVNGYSEELLRGQDFDLYFRFLKQNMPHVRDEVPGSYYDQDHSGQNRLPALRIAASARCSIVRSVLDWLRKEKPTYLQQELPYFNAAALKALQMMAAAGHEQLPYWKETFFPGGLNKHPIDWSELSWYFRLYPQVGLARGEQFKQLVSLIKGR